MAELKSSVITRFAPSPTGFMHVGGVRTAIYAYLWAKKNNGKFILRIEDTDKEREVEGSKEHIQESLKWLGLDWDVGPYFQSEHLDLYKKYADILIKKGFAYPDPYTEEEVEAFRKQAETDKKPFLFRNHRPEKFGAWDGTQPLRFKVPEIKKYSWNDLVYGDLSAGEEALDDFILIKADGYPTYNFAHIVDDIEMAVTHVMRGEEFISSTPKYLSVYEALELKPPLYATLPVILGKEGTKKLSKRDGAKDILEYRNEGYLPEALVNFLVLLGWNPGDDREIFNINELMEAFSIERIQKSPARLNQEKLDWINKEHIKLLPSDIVEKNILEKLPSDFHGIAKSLIPVILERITKWSDVAEMASRGELDFFVKAPEISKEKLIFKDTPAEQIKNNLSLAESELKNINEADFNKENIKDVLMKVAEGVGNRGELLHPVRYALSGLERSPDPFIIAEIIGKNETLKRIENAKNL